MKVILHIDPAKLADAANARVDIPYVPESVEGKLFREGVEAGVSALAAAVGTYGNEFVAVSVEA